MNRTILNQQEFEASNEVKNAYLDCNISSEGWYCDSST